MSLVESKSVKKTSILVKNFTRKMCFGTFFGQKFFFTKMKIQVPRPFFRFWPVELFFGPPVEVILDLNRDPLSRSILGSLLRSFLPSHVFPLLTHGKQREHFRPNFFEKKPNFGLRRRNVKHAGGKYVTGIF